MLEEAINILVGRFTNHAVWAENKNLGFHKFLRLRPGPVSPYLIQRLSAWILTQVTSLAFGQSKTQFTSIFVVENPFRSKLI